MAQTGFTPLLIYSSSTATNAPSAGNLLNNATGSELAINIADGKLFYKDSGGSVQVIAWKTTPTTAGGTGLTSYTAGDMVYWASGTAFTNLGIGAANTIMTSSGSAPQWSTGLVLSGDITARGFYASGVFAGTYADGLVMDYSTPTARFTAGTADGFAWYNGGISSRTTLMTLSSAGVIGTATWNGATIGVAYGGTGATTSTGSGSVVLATSPTISSPTISGTGITFPYGTNAQAAPAKVLQVIQASSTGTVTIASGQTTPTAWQSVVSASITPLFSTSKILILFNVSWSMSSGNIYSACGFAPFRGTVGGSSVGPVYTLIGYDTSAALGQRINEFCASALDNPATTSAVTYNIGARSENGNGLTSSTVSLNNYGPTTITLMEIAQ
jgi:hypothetical protein